MEKEVVVDSIKKIAKTFLIIASLAGLVLIMYTLFFSDETRIVSKETLGHCEDKIDNDHDGFIDLNDFGCLDSDRSSETNEGFQECNDGIDNDNDRLIDQDDTDCNFVYSKEDGSVVIENKENKNALCGNGFIENNEECDRYNLGDFSCSDFGFDSGNLNCTKNCLFDISNCVVYTQCNDGFDNDNDGKIDEPEDCVNEFDDSEGLDSFSLLNETCKDLGERLSKAVQYASPENFEGLEEEIVCFSEGDYGSLNINSSNLIITSEKNSLVKFEFLNVDSSENVSIRGLIISGNSTSLVGIKNSRNVNFSNSVVYSEQNLSKGILSLGSSWINFERLLIYNVSSGFEIDSGNSSIKNSVIQSFSLAGINSSSSGVVIKNNLIRNPARVSGVPNGIFFSGNLTSDILIGSNKIFGNSETFRGINVFSDCSRCVIQNNVLVADSSAYGIGLLRNSSDSKIIGNTVYGKLGQRINVASGSNNIVANNLIFSLFSGGLKISGNNTIKNNLGLNPYLVNDYLVNVKNFNIHLIANSPAIDSGDNEYSSEFDFEGEQRPKGINVDIGADEF